MKKARLELAISLAALGLVNCVPGAVESQLLSVHNASARHGERTTPTSSTPAEASSLLPPISVDGGARGVSSLDAGGTDRTHDAPATTAISLAAVVLRTPVASEVDEARLDLPATVRPLSSSSCPVVSERVAVPVTRPMPMPMPTLSPCPCACMHAVVHAHV